MASAYVLFDPFFRSLASGTSVIGFIVIGLTTALNKNNILNNENSIYVLRSHTTESKKVSKKIYISTTITKV